MYRILMIRFSSMGDIVLTTPVVRAIRRKFPEARIDYVTKQQFADLIRNNPRLTTVYTYDNRTGLAGLRTLGYQLREHRYDLFVDLHNNFRSWILQFMLRPRHTVRFSKCFIKRTVLVQTGINLYARPIMQVPERYLQPLRKDGVENDDQGLELFPTDEHRAKVLEIFRNNALSDDELVIGFGPIASFALKQWPVERFAELGREIVKRDEARILLFGGTSDLSQVERLVDRIPNHPILLCGRLSMMESAAALERCALFVGNDTGTAHIAAAMGCKVVGLFGPTVEEFGFYPYKIPSVVVSKSLPCRPCTHTGKGHCKIKTHACMQEITIAEVLEAVHRLLAGT